PFQSQTGSPVSHGHGRRNYLIKGVRSQDSDYPTTSLCEPESLPGFPLVVNDRVDREGIRRMIR
ncbi:MAG: hypothetical protein WEA57_01675, partial [Acidimicrobiia bacterium]